MLDNLLNAREMQQKLHDAIIKDIRLARVHMTDRDYHMKSNVIFGMAHGLEMPETGFISPFSLAYFPTFVPRVIRLAIKFGGD